MKKIVKNLEIILDKAGDISTVVVLLLVLLVSLDVIIRYLFQFTFIWITELETYLFGFIILLPIGYTLKNEGHVRVDVFYTKFSKKIKALVNILGGCFFLLPWVYVTASASWLYAYKSFLIKEKSAQPGVFPFVYVIKMTLFVGISLLLIQGILEIIKSLRILISKNN